RSADASWVGTRAALHLGANGAANAGALPGARVSSVSAVVVTHEPDAALEDCLAALAPQVSELAVVANLPLELDLPPNARLVENPRPRGFSANINRGVAATRGDFAMNADRDTAPAAD